MLKHSVIVVLSCLALIIPSAEAQPPVWRDPSPHKVTFVTVGEGVTLEVLDWGGSGRALVLLAGSGNSAHVFDEFAPKLVDCCHVYGVTRRGHGVSSRPQSGYQDQRLADDVFQVIERLKIDHPVLAVAFTDGTRQEIDFRPVWRGALFGPLRDLAAFNAVTLDREAGTLTWPNGADFDPATLHDWPEVCEELAARAQAWTEPTSNQPRANTRIGVQVCTGRSRLSRRRLR